MDPIKIANPSPIINKCRKIGALDGDHQVSMNWNEENKEQNVHDKTQASIDATQNNNNAGCNQEKDTTSADDDVNNEECKGVKDNINGDNNSNDKKKVPPLDVNNIINTNGVDDSNENERNVKEQNIDTINESNDQEQTKK